MALGAVEMMRFLCDRIVKISSKGGISDIKIGQKSGNLDKDFLHFGGM